MERYEKVDPEIIITKLKDMILFYEKRKLEKKNDNEEEFKIIS